MGTYNCSCSGPEDCAICAGYGPPDDDDFEPDDDFDEDYAIQQAESRYENYLDRMKEYGP